MRVVPIVAVSLFAAVSAASAQQKNAMHADAAAAPAAIVVMPGTETWGAAPAILPAGARLAVVEGNPMEPGPFTMRLWMPAGYRIPPHFHEKPEHVTVLKGTFLVGMGEVVDDSKMASLAAGSFGMLPPGMRHFAMAGEETVIQLHGIGPWGLIYVNAADDPRNAGK